MDHNRLKTIEIETTVYRLIFDSGISLEIAKKIMPTKQWLISYARHSLKVEKKYIKDNYFIRFFLSKLVELWHICNSVDDNYSEKTAKLKTYFRIICKALGQPKIYINSLCSLCI